MSQNGEGVERELWFLPQRCSMGRAHARDPPEGPLEPTAHGVISEEQLFESQSGTGRGLSAGGRGRGGELADYKKPCRASFDDGQGRLLLRAMRFLLSSMMTDTRRTTAREESGERPRH